MKVLTRAVIIVLVVVVAWEIILRLWDPFQFRQGYNSVILPRNRKMIFTNSRIPVLDKKVIHTKNSLGFRGPEPPRDWDTYTTIIAVGEAPQNVFT